MLRVICIVALLNGLLACTDPGCIRNSECGTAYRCRQARCVLANLADSGLASGSAGNGSNLGSGDNGGSSEPPSDAAVEPAPDAAVAGDGAASP
jgi:hypothetical protein